MTTTKPMAPSSYLGHSAPAMARTFAEQNRMASGYLRVVDHERRPFTHFFVFAHGWAAPHTYSPNLKSISINGLCPWCGIIFPSENALFRCIAPNPQAGMIVPESRWKGEAVVAEYGLTFACEHCRKHHNLRALSSVTSQVDESEWYGLETAESKRFRQFRMIPPIFRWERDAGQYVTLNLDEHTITTSTTLWEPI